MFSAKKGIINQSFGDTTLIQNEPPMESADIKETEDLLTKLVRSEIQPELDRYTDKLLRRVNLHEAQHSILEVFDLLQMQEMQLKVDLINN